MDDLLPAEVHLRKQLTQRVEPGCLEAEALLEIAEKGPKSHDFVHRMAHVAACGRCFSTLSELRSLQPSSAPEKVKSRAWMWLLVPAAAVLIGVFLWRQEQDRQNLAEWKRSRFEQPDVPFNPGIGDPIPEKAPRFEALRDQPTPPDWEKGFEMPDFSPEVAPVVPDSSPRTLVANLTERSDGLYEGETKIWDGVTLEVRLIGWAPEDVRGSADPTVPDVVLTAPPIGDRLLPDLRPRFTWKRIASARHYRAKLVRLPLPDDASSPEVALDVTGLTARPKTNLDPGRRYRLTIEADLAIGDPLDGPSSLSSTYLFETPIELQTKRREWARENTSAAPISAAMVYFALGCYAEAERTMPRNEDPKLMKWRRHLEEMLKKRLAEPAQ